VSVDNGEFGEPGQRNFLSPAWYVSIDPVNPDRPVIVNRSDKFVEREDRRIGKPLGLVN
jgi:hypothetical protein